MNHPSPSRRHVLATDVAVTLLAAAAGLLVRGLEGVTASLTPTSFASIFPLLAGLLRGPVVGAIASLLRSFPLPGVRTQEPAVVLVTALAVAAIVLLVRRGWTDWIAGVTVWGVVAAPVIVLMDRVGLVDPKPAMLPLTITLQGCCNALFAGLLLDWGPLARWRDRAPAPFTLGRALDAGFARVALVPVLVLAIGGGEYAVRLRKEEQARHVERTAAVTAEHLGEQLASGSRVVRTLARTLAAHAAADPGHDAADVQALLEATGRVNSGFLTMLVADTTGRVVAGTPKERFRAAARSAPTIADRDYFRASRDGRGFVSNAFRGRGFGADVIVAVSEPVLDARDHVLAVAEGSLDLGELRALASEHGLGARVILLDASRQVVHASPETGLAPLTRYDLARAEHRFTGEPRARYRAGPGGDWVVATARAPQGWVVVIEQSLAPLAAEATRARTATLLAAVLALLVSLLVGRGVARSVREPVDALLARVRAFDASVSAGTPPCSAAVEGPARHAPEEIRTLTDDFDRMAARVRVASASLQRVLAERVALNDELAHARDGLEAEVRQRTAALEEALHRAEAASAAKSTFLATMSHELRTPLNAIIGFTSVVQRNTRDLLPRREADFLDRVRANSLHLLGIIDDILDIARIESGKLRLEVQPVDVGQLVQEVVRQLDTAPRGGEVQLLALVPSGLVPLATDRTRLSQVLVNLVGNALKFTHRGSVVVEVVAHADGTPAAVQVRDTGIGIAPERLAAIFEAFEQGEMGTSRRYGGSGLGLAISRVLCRVLGARLTVESEVGRGSTFTIVLSPEVGERAA